MQSSFFFVTSEVELQEIEFEESKAKGARILATFMELNIPSANNRIYRVEEAGQLAKSLIGKPIRYGANWIGEHIKNVSQIGIVEKAWQEANKIKGIVRIWDKGIVETLKAGTKYLFSVGGVADFEEYISKGKEVFRRLWNAVCTHLQLLNNNPSGAGFPTAKMHKVIEINESVMISQCDGDNCPILKGVKTDFEEARQRKEAIEKTIYEAIIKEICDSIMTVSRVIVEK